MALYYDLPVYRDTYKLILKIFEYTKDFPKDYKYTLGQDMKRDALHLVRIIYRANKSVQKKEHLDDFMDDFELIKLEIRLCTDMKVLPIKKQAELSLLMMHTWAAVLLSLFLNENQRNANKWFSAMLVDEYVLGFLFANQRLFHLAD